MDREIGSATSEPYRQLSNSPQVTARAGYVLAVSGALALVTFTLVYLTTLSYASGF